MAQARSGRSSSIGKQVNHQQATHRLRQRVIGAINKLSDRDTYTIASAELESVARSLNSDGFSPFLSCLYDTDSQQKSTVRKECVKLFATMADAHGDSLSPHLSRMVGNVVRRLKDPDSNVRDACVDAIGVMASRITDSNSSISAFVKPFWEAIGEQNRYLQVGSALCLSRAIDNAADPQLPGLLQRLLPRIVKLLGNPNFMGKAALLSLVGSVIEAGGASTQQALSGLIPSMQEALRSNDWATRRAASDAFCRMASDIGPPLLSPFKSSCIASLESCRFDKVKPVRDSVIQTLQAWTSIPDSDGHLPSPESSVKENMYDGHLSAGLNPSHPSKPDSVSLTKNKVAVSRSPPDTSSVSSTEKRTPLIDRKTKPSFPKKGRRKVNDWQFEVNIPRSQPKQVFFGEDFAKSYNTNAPTKGKDRRESNSNFGGYQDSETVEKMETPRPSDVETKCIMIDQTSGVKHHMVEIASNEKQQTNTTSTDGSTNQCNRHDANDLTLIRKQLFQIENQQSSLLELIQNFIGSSQEGMRSLESRVHGLERTVDEMAQDLAVSTGRLSNSSIEGGRGTCCKFPGTEFLSSKFWRKSDGRYATVRIATSDASSLSKFGGTTDNPDNRRHKGMHGGFIVNPLADIRGASRKESIESISDSSQKPILENLKGDNLMTGSLDRNRFGEGPSARSVWKASKDEATLSAIRVAGKDGKTELESVKENSRPNTLDTTTENLSSSRSRHGTIFWSVWTRAVEFLRTGDVDSAFVEVLCTGDDLLLLRLMNRTGPILEHLSQGTIVEMLQTIVQFLMKHKYLESIILWFQQVVDLASNGADCLDLPPEAKKDTLSALKEAPSLRFMDASNRHTISQIASKLSTIWAADLSRSR
eukprot:PITA_17584